MFQTVSLFIIMSLAMYTQQLVFVIQVMLTACWRDQDGTYCCVYSARLLMMDTETVQKHLEFYSKNKIQKLVHLIGFIIRRK
jgi:hypothetical protein